MATRNIFNADASNERENQQSVNELSKAYKEAAKAAGLLTDEEKELLGLSQQLELSLQNIIASKVLRNNESRSSKKITEEIRNLEKSRLEQDRIGLDLTSKLNQQLREQRIERITSGREINYQNVVINKSQIELENIQYRINKQREKNLQLEYDMLEARKNGNLSSSISLNQQLRKGILQQKYNKDLEKVHKQDIQFANKEIKNQQQIFDFSNKKIESLNNAKNINSSILAQLDDEIKLLKEAEKLQLRDETQKKIGDFVYSKFTGLLAILGLKNLIEELFKADKLITNIASTLGISKTHVQDMRSRYVNFVQTVKDGSISVIDMMEAQLSMNKELGTSIEFSDIEKQTWNDITKLMNVSATSAARLMQLSKATNMSQKQYLETVLESSYNSQKQLKLQVSSQEVLETIGKLSAGILIKFQNNPIALGKAVIEAKKLGLSLEQVDKIGDSLLNWESSIESTLKAELLTGRQLNLERARAAALTGNQSDLMEEISRQAGKQEDFMNMNVLARRSLAEAFGLNVDEMSEMLLKQQLLNQYGEEASKLNQKQFEEQQKSGLSMGEYLAKQAKQMEMQEQFNNSMDKLKQIVIDIVDGPFGAFMKSMTTILNNALLIKSAFVGISMILGGMMVKNIASMILGMTKLVGLSLSKLAADTLDNAILTAGIGTAIGLAAGLYALSTAKSEVNKASDIQITKDGIAPASKGPFTITDSYGATAITTKGDGLAVSPNINRTNNSQNQYDYKRLEDKFDKLIAINIQQFDIQKQGTTLQINEFALGKASPLASAKENSRNFY